MKMILGCHLPEHLQRQARATYVHRFTGEHKPDWARKEWKDGKPYPVQFKDDADWLAHTKFPVTSAGKLSKRPSACISTPTWPGNPELREHGFKFATTGRDNQLSDEAPTA
jgi:hypothetical protein